MAVITINGHYGCHAVEIGTEVARNLDCEFMDRVILAKAADQLGSTIDILEEEINKPLSRVNRISRFLQLALERSAAAGTGGDPYFGPGLGNILGRDFLEITPDILSNNTLPPDDKRFIEVTTAVINEVANSGNAVIAGRGSNMILGSYPDAFHVNLVATIEYRIPVVAASEDISERAAREMIEKWDKAREDYFQKFFGVTADDPINFHLVINTEKLDYKPAASLISIAVKS